MRLFIYLAGCENVISSYEQIALVKENSIVEPNDHQMKSENENFGSVSKIILNQIFNTN